MNKILQGDCLASMKIMTDNSVDAIVTDPPYGLSFMGKKWDYDVPSQEIWEEALRVLKPGGYLLAFAGTRTQHRMAVRIEDAGFEIRDMIAWVYGSGFPKSLNIGKAIDKLQGNEREDLGLHPQPASSAGDVMQTGLKNEARITKCTSEWEGWGTALKPAIEPITVARKPISEKTVAENVLKWGTGGINIDGCRVGKDFMKGGSAKSPGDIMKTGLKTDYKSPDRIGRFPANFIHDGSDEVVDLFPNSKSGNGKANTYEKQGGQWGKGKQIRNADFGDSGSASRFFYCAKASKSERNKGCENLNEKERIRQDLAGEKNNTFSKNFHPTVKPIALMEYLVKLVSKENTIILDPFTGSGSTGVACKNLNRQFIGCELSEEYCEIIKARTGFEVVKSEVSVVTEVKETPKVEKPKIKGLSACCSAKVIKGYCESCCEKV